MGDTDLLRLIPTMQSASLVSRNAKFLKKKKKNFVKQGVENIIGIKLTEATANSII